MTARQARLMLLLPDELVAEIDEHRRTEQDIPTRTEMIRRLIARGLEADRRQDSAG